MKNYTYSDGDYIDYLLNRSKKRKIILFSLLLTLFILFFFISISAYKKTYQVYEIEDDQTNYIINDENYYFPELGEE